MPATEPLSPDRSAALRRAQLSYTELGASLGELPAGYSHLDRARLIGHGPDAFRIAADRLLGWGVQLGAGLRVRAERVRIEREDVVELGLGWGTVRMWSPCRVVVVLDENDRRGFAYGTLPGHPEIGEEAFLVTIDEHQQVWLRIRAFSRPGPSWVRWLQPAARIVQQRITTRYLDALTPMRPVA